jgi:hypothetical protein
MHQQATRRGKIYTAFSVRIPEVKTKATTERVENAFKWNNFSGGSYANWCALDNEKTHVSKDKCIEVCSHP